MSKGTLHSEKPQMPIQPKKSKKKLNNTNDRSLSKADEASQFHQMPSKQPSKKGIKSQDFDQKIVQQPQKSQFTDTINKLKNPNASPEKKHLN
jgi:hypothetical protein